MASLNRLAIRKRWLLLPVVVAVGLGGGYLATAVAEPQYKATCRLFVAVAAETTPAETYQGSVLSQDRVVAYLQLIKGERVAQEAINRHRLNISAPDLVDRIEATAALKSVLMEVSVTDPQSSRSAELANAVCDVFPAVAADTERPNTQINVKMVEIASAPQYPISPNGQQNLAIGALVGLLAGLGLILGLDRILPAGEPEPKAVQSDDDSVYTPATGVPEPRTSRHYDGRDGPE